MRPLLPLIFLCGLAISLPGGENDHVLTNGDVRLEFRSGVLTNAAYKGGPNLLREMRTMALLHPDAREEQSRVISSRPAPAAEQRQLIVRREGKAFTAEEIYSLASNAPRLQITVRIRMKMPLKIGIIRMNTVRSSMAADTILHSDERELGMASSAATLDNLANSDDFYHGIYDSNSQTGLLIIAPGNRDSHANLFRNYRKMPGRFELGSELKTGPFGEMRSVAAGDTLTHTFELLFVGNAPEKELNALFPGASVKPKRKSGLDADVRVFFDPTLYRDDKRMFLLGDFPNPLALLFYRAKIASPPGKGIKLRLELPSEITLAQIVPFQYWVPGAIQPPPPGKEIVRDGRKYRSYLLAAPDPITALGDKNLFDSFKQHQLYLYLQTPKVAVPTKFDYSWQLVKEGMPDGELNRASGEILPWQPNRDVPRRVKLWYSNTPMRHLVWADAAQQRAYLDMFRSQGISVLPSPETSPYMKPVFPDLKNVLRRSGFQIHSPYDYLRKSAMINLKNPVPGSVWTTLNGKAMYKGNNPQHSFCPNFLLREDTALHRQLAEAFGKLDTDYMWHDWEGKTFQGCYCPDCRKAFAAFAALPAAEIQRLTPVELIRKHTLPWIRFRHHQSALMFAKFKRLANTDGRKIASGMDYLYVNTDTVYPKLGRGCAIFCEDPRLMTEAQFDFVLPDALWSGLMAYDQVAVAVKETNLPVIPKSGSVGGLAFYAGSWVSRRLMAEYQRRDLGLDAWPRLARISALGHISSGAQGVMLEGAPLDALTMLEYIRLAVELARTEDDYLSGRDITPECRFYDCSGQLQAAKIDNTSGAQWTGIGGSPGDLWRGRIHERNGAFLLSFFNFDPARKRQVRFMPPAAGLAEMMTLYDPVTYEGILSPSGRQAWSKAELAKGIILAAPPVDSALLRLAPSGSVKVKRFHPCPVSRDPGKLRQARPLGQGRLEDQLEQEIANFPFGGI